MAGTFTSATSSSCASVFINATRFLLQVFALFLHFWVLGFGLNTTPPPTPIWRRITALSSHLLYSNFHILLPHYPLIEIENMWRSIWERTMWLGLANDVPVLVLQPWAGPSICRHAGEKHQIITRQEKIWTLTPTPLTNRTIPPSVYGNTKRQVAPYPQSVFPPSCDPKHHNWFLAKEDFSNFSKHNCFWSEYEARLIVLNMSLFTDVVLHSGD